MNITKLSNSLAKKKKNLNLNLLQPLDLTFSSYKIQWTGERIKWYHKYIISKTWGKFYRRNNSIFHK